ncbi:MAG TPA: nuclear transport factor 2 family protein [Candidatus Sulfotelmatobacter sp.]
MILSHLMALPLQGQDSEVAAVQSKILALEHVWNQAEGSKDLKALDSIFDNALVYVDSDGSLLTKAEFLSRVKSAPIEQVTTQSMTVEIFDNTAVVTGTYQAIGFKDGKPTLSRGRFIDTWARRNFNWVCVAAQATPILR